jgi:hypothetical protein
MHVRDTVMLLRRNDPWNECREIILSQFADSWSVCEVIRFLSDLGTVRSFQRALGPESKMRAFFTTVVEELRNEGFTVCSRREISATGRGTQTSRKPIGHF